MCHAVGWVNKAWCEIGYNSRKESQVEAQVCTSYTWGILERNVMIRKAILSDCIPSRSGRNEWRANPPGNNGRIIHL